MDSRSGKRPGFTMVEMLTVIAMIAILAAILFPVFANVRKKVHQATCISNMQQLSVALNLYHDANNRYPLAMDAFVANGRTYRTLYPTYAKSEDMFRCPLNAYRQSDKSMAAFGAAQLTPASLTVKRFPIGGGSGGTNVCMDARGGPKSIRNNCLAGEQKVSVQFPMRDSYDGAFVPNLLSPTTAWEVHYSRDWTEQPASIADNPRQLKYREPPANAVVTWCMNHIDNIDASGVPHGPVPVLFKDGKVVLKRGEQFAFPGWSQDGNTWRVYP